MTESATKKPKKDDPQSRCALVMARFKRAEAAKKPFEPIWYECCALARGNDLRWDDRRGCLVSDDPTYKPWVRRNVAKRDRVTPLCRITKGKLLAMKLDVDVVAVPAQDEEQAKERKQHALIANRYLDYVDRIVESPTLDIDVAEWKINTGQAFRKIYWDKNKGDIKQIGKLDEGGNLITDENDQPVPGETVREGQICETILGPFDAFPDPDATSDRDMLWFIHRIPQRRSKAILTYGDAAAKCTADDKTVAVNFDQMLSGMTSYNNGGSTRGADSDEEDDPLIVVYEHWEAPTKEHPKGRVWHVGSGDVELTAPRDLYMDPRTQEPFIPIVKDSYSKAAGCFWSAGVVVGLIEPQKTRNTLLSAIHRIIRRCAHPLILEPKQGRIAEDAFIGEDGERVQYVYPFKPEIVPPPPMTGELYRGIEIADVDMQEITNIREVTKGTNPSGVTAGIALSILAEKDNVGQGETYALAASAAIRRARMILNISQQYLVEERVLALTGSSAKAMGADSVAVSSEVLGNIQDVRLEEGSSQNNSVLAQKQAALDLLNTRVWDMIGDPNVAYNYGLQVLEIFGQNLSELLKPRPVPPPIPGMPGGPGGVIPPEMPPEAGGIPPELLQLLDAVQQNPELLSQLPPELAEMIAAILQQAPQAA